MAAYQMYRETTLGVALKETLDDYVSEGMITTQLANKVMACFDKNVNKALATRSKNKVQFKAEKLVTYRFCDNVWTFILENVEFRDVNRSVDHMVNKVKIVACDGKAASLLASNSGQI